jgi:hypothetical protein
VQQSGDFDVESVAMTSSGSYSNIACGTGTATSSSNSVVATRIFGTRDLTALWPGRDLSYKITFANGVGVLQFTNPGIPGTAAVRVDAQLDGFDPVSNVWTTHFTVTGVVALGQVGLDTKDQACSTTGGNGVPGAHPAADATVEGQHVLLDAYNASGGTWLCADAGPAGGRVTLPVG